MWRIVFVLCVLSSAAVAGETKRVLQVGITITGNGSPAVRAKSPARAAGKMAGSPLHPATKRAAPGMTDGVSSADDRSLWGWLRPSR